MSFEFPAWDPVLFDLPGPIDVRWYGLTYVIGFVIASWIVGRLARRGFLPLEEGQVGDLMVWLLFGVILGGRFGYAVFYDQSLLLPQNLLQIWKGGMSFHGGLIGVFVAFLWFSAKYKLPWLRLGDSAAMCVTPGIFLVRFANFINGELFGRIAPEGSKFGMRFPTDAAATLNLGLQGLGGEVRSKELAIQVAYGKREWADVEAVMAKVDGAGRAIPWETIAPKLDWERVAPLVPYRYPSQLFEGLSEGLLLGLILWVVYRLTSKRPLAPGGYGGIFLAGYGIARFLLEYVRQPDAQFADAEDPVGTVLFGMTMGQTLSSVMVVAGIYFLVRGLRGRPAAVEPTASGAPA